MNKIVLVLFSSLLIAVSYLGFTNPANSLQWLFTVNPGLQLVRLGIAALLLAYAIFPKSRQPATVRLMRLLGVLILAVAAVNFWYPDTFGTISLEATPLDMLTFVESGIIILLAGLEPQWDPVFDYMPLRASDTEPNRKREREFRFPWQRNLLPTHFRLASLVGNFTNRTHTPSPTPS